MAGYGVTEDPEGLLDWSWAEQRLLGERTFWFVTANAEGRPHSMPVWGVWMPERERFGMCCDSGARKVRNIKTNDQVVVTTTNSVECVSLEGRAVLVEGDEAEPLAVAWAEKYCDDNFSKEDMMEAVYAAVRCVRGDPRTRLRHDRNSRRVLKMRHALALGLTSAPSGTQPHRAAEPNRAEMHISWFVELVGC